MPTTRYPEEKPNDFSIFLKVISLACGISAIILISLAIAFPNGITYYEDRMPVKIFEILISLIAVTYLLHDLGITIRKSKWLKK